MPKPKKNNGKFYEETVYRIYNSLEPPADVRINDKIVGRDINIERQIDVSVRATIVYQVPPDVNITGQLNSVIKDVVLMIFSRADEEKGRQLLVLKLQGLFRAPLRCKVYC